MGYAVPVEDLLLLLGANAIVLVEEIQEARLGLLEGGIGARFQIPQIRKDALFEFLGVLDRPSEGLKSERQTPHDVGAGDVKEIVPVFVNTAVTASHHASTTYHRTQETYSPVGKRNLRMY